MSSSAIVIFGGTGDLSYRKLYPALYDLHKLGKLSEEFKIVGIGRRDYTDEDYTQIIKKWNKDFSRLDYTDEDFNEFKKKITYINMDFSNEKNYYKLEEMFEKLNISDEIMYYFAVSPDFFIPITKGLSTISKRLENAKIIVEKPFGKDLESAKKLNEEFKKYLKYENIYYIDHYLGKEMLLNIMTIRFFNSMFNGVWNKEFVDNVQITVSETVGVETRGNYYDKAGAIADMLQNHLLQILSVVAMDEPQNFTTHDIKEAQTDIFRKLRRISNDDIQDYMVLGQYDGYKDEDKVDKNSNTETYVAMKLFVDNDRWMNVPFYLRTGKKLKYREIEIVIQFLPTQSAVKMLSQDYTNGDLQKISENNYLSIKIQPDEGIKLNFNVKKPSTEDKIDVASLDYCQSCIAENIINTPQAYERLLESAINSNRTLFSTWEQIQLSWQYMNDFVDRYKKNIDIVYRYEQGTNGPVEANEILKKDGRKWIYTKE